MVNSSKPPGAIAAAMTLCKENLAVSEAQLERARDLQRAGARAEDILWACIERKQLLGFEFVRDKVIDAYVADFYCPAARLLVELGEPTCRESNPRVCDRWARRQGLRIIRLHRREVETNTEQVLNVLAMVLSASPAEAAGSPVSP